ncbi:MAG TPA: hypothetical protein VKA94_01550 [Hyphomicrobiales bacterium]|nr:hypothetical protein [Hyphomicrobiales bacterium]
MKIRGLRKGAFGEISRTGKVSRAENRCFRKSGLPEARFLMEFRLLEGRIAAELDETERGMVGKFSLVEMRACGKFRLAKAAILAEAGVAEFRTAAEARLHKAGRALELDAFENRIGLEFRFIETDVADKMAALKFRDPGECGIAEIGACKKFRFLEARGRYERAGGFAKELHLIEVGRGRERAFVEISQPVKFGFCEFCLAIKTGAGEIGHAGEIRLAEIRYADEMGPDETGVARKDKTAEVGISGKLRSLEIRTRFRKPGARLVVLPLAEPVRRPVACRFKRLFAFQQLERPAVPRFGATFPKRPRLFLIHTLRAPLSVSFSY